MKESILEELRKNTKRILNEIQQTKKELQMENNKNYKWKVESLSIAEVIKFACEDDGKDFMIWCFMRDYKLSDNILSVSNNGKDLLEELQKPERESWLEFAINRDYVEEFESEEFFCIGDVIELIDISSCKEKYIINASDRGCICLNDKDGRSWNFSFKIKGSLKRIPKKEIADNIVCCTSFKKVGHGAKDLI